MISNGHGTPLKLTTSRKLSHLLSLIKVQISIMADEPLVLYEVNASGFVATAFTSDYMDCALRCRLKAA